MDDTGACLPACLPGRVAEEDPEQCPRPVVGEVTIETPELRLLTG